jgi:hypothetical protein
MTAATTERVLEGLPSWLLEHAHLPLTELHGAFVEEMLRRGLPLWRCNLGLELLHPEQSGLRSCGRAARA